MVEKVAGYEREIHHPEPASVYEQQYALFLSLYEGPTRSFKELAATGTSVKRFFSPP